MTMRQTPAEVEARRKQLAQRSWALAEMYLQPLFPPVEKQMEIEAKYNLWLDTMESMMAAGVSYHVARRTYLGLPPYPLAEEVAKWGYPTFGLPRR